MTRSLRSFAALSVVALASLSGLAGCVTECHKDENTGQKVCTAVTPTQYDGSTISKSATWAPGTNIRIDVKGGNLRSGFAATAITVTGGGAAGTVAVNFRPFESNTKEKADQAKTELTENLVVDVTESNGEVLVTVAETGTHQTSLSARVDLVLPSDFAGLISATSESGDVQIAGANGGVQVQTSNADVDVSGAIHGLSVATDNGDISVTLGEPALPEDTGSLTTDRDIALFLPIASDIGLTAAAGEGVTFAPDPLPEGWESAESSEAAKSLTGNAGSTTSWTLDNSSFSFSHITVTLQ